MQTVARLNVKANRIVLFEGKMMPSISFPNATTASHMKITRNVKILSVKRNRLWHILQFEKSETEIIFLCDV